jgi:hypothetical protein
MIIFIGLCTFIGYIILMAVMYGAMPNDRGGLNYRKYYKEIDDSRRERRAMNLNKCYGKD